MKWIYEIILLWFISIIFYDENLPYWEVRRHTLRSSYIYFIRNIIIIIYAKISKWYIGMPRFWNIFFSNGQLEVASKIVFNTLFRTLFFFGCKLLKLIELNDCKTYNHVIDHLLFWRCLFNLSKKGVYSIFIFSFRETHY